MKKLNIPYGSFFKQFIPAGHSVLTVLFMEFVTKYTLIPEDLSKHVPSKKLMIECDVAMDKILNSSLPKIFNDIKSF